MKIFLSCILFFFALQLGASPQLSEEAKISLLTCSPGKALYEAFGHTALRVSDPVLGLDKTYNYGTFDFNQPNFYLNFAQGRQYYMLSIAPTRYFIGSYMYDNRSVYEDVLNLTLPQKQALFEMLEENYLPENRNYRYDYIYDNCATRIRDIVNKVLEGNVVFDSAHITQVYSFRQLMDLYLEPQPWGDLGIDLALSSTIDVKAHPYQYMFLPDFLQSAFQNAYLPEADSMIPLIKESRTIYTAIPENETKGFLTPSILFWCIFIFFLALTCINLSKKKYSVLPDVILFFLIGLMGVIIAQISFFSDHHAARNYNLLWALPTHLLFALLLPFKKLKLLHRYYSFITIAITTFAIAGSLSFFPQQIHVAAYPLMLTLLLRSGMIFKHSKTEN